MILLFFVFKVLKNKNEFFLILKKISFIFLISILILSPILAYISSYLITYNFQKTHDPEVWSADLLGFIIPSRVQTIGNFFTGITNNFTGNDAETNNYLGISVIILAILGIWKYHYKFFVQFLAFSSIIFFILALGMHLNIAGIRTSIPLPYLFFYKFIPGISITGVPTRFTIMVLFCLCILAALGFQYFYQRMHNSYKKIFAILVIFIIFMEFISVPFPISRFEIPQFYKDISFEQNNYAIIDLHENPSQVLYYQTIHNKKILEGYVSKKTKESEDFIKNTPVIYNIFYNKPLKEVAPNNDINITDISPEVAKNILSSYEIKYIIVPNNIINVAIKNIALDKIYEDNQITVYVL
jgi:hypothetical protein